MRIESKGKGSSLGRVNPPSDPGGEGSRDVSSEVCGERTFQRAEKKLVARALVLEGSAAPQRKKQSQGGCVQRARVKMVQCEAKRWAAARTSRAL